MSRAANGIGAGKYIASSVDLELGHRTAPTMTAPASTPAMSQAALFLVLSDALPNSVPAACPALSMIHLSSLARSLALCQRSSGGFARHFLIVWSSAGGVIGFTALIGAGSFSRMAETTLSWLFPSNARCPVYFFYGTATS